MEVELSPDRRIEAVKKDCSSLLYFCIVAEEQSFSRAANRLGLTQTTLSHAVKKLEDQLGTRLLIRTQRGVTPTPVGDSLIDQLNPAFRQIEEALWKVRDFSDEPMGRLRIAVPSLAFDLFLAPQLHGFMQRFPRVQLELSLIDSPVDFSDGRFDAIVQAGDILGRDIATIPFLQEIEATVVGSPEFFARYPKPTTPSELSGLPCVIARTNAESNRWVFQRHGKSWTIAVQGPLTVADSRFLIESSMHGVGLALLPRALVHEPIKKGMLIPVLEDWSPCLSGFSLYYPIRRDTPRALKVLVDELRVPQIKQ